MTALAILGDTESPELPRWQADIDLVRDVLCRFLSDNQLAGRCADILDHLLPLGFEGNMRFESMNQFDPTTMDFSLWSADPPSDVLGAFNWAYPGQGI